MKQMIDAEVTIKFVIQDLIEVDDFDLEMDCFLDLVVERIEEEGLYSLIEETDDYEVVDAVAIH